MARNFGPRKTKQWDGIGATSLSFTGNNTLNGFSLAFTEAATVLRMLGEYIVTPGAAPAIDDFAVITVALGIISTDAANLGATAMPDPSTEPEYPWLYWASHQVHYESTAVETGSAATSVRRSFDVRSMRKVKPRESLQWVVQYSDNNGTPPIVVGLATLRVLLAIH